MCVVVVVVVVVVAVVVVDVLVYFPLSNELGVPGSLNAIPHAQLSK